jgi:hypothetical protein
LEPGLDTDGDGLDDEVDPDNDGDGLDDEVEIAGTAFDPLTPTDPNRPDTDGDGALDSEEMAAGTNAQDPTAALRIIAVTGNSGAVRIEWLGRGGRTYLVRTAADLDAGFEDIAEARLSGGSGPWQVVTGLLNDVSATVATSKFYTVILRQP